MLFNSYEFMLIFLPVVLILWWALAKMPQWRFGMLTLASYFFYGWWDWRFTSLMLVSTVIDYVAGQRIQDARDDDDRSGMKKWLLLSLLTNLGLLGAFKYTGFAALSLEGINGLFSDTALFSEQAKNFLTGIILPVGISFYTFQSMSYSLDIYKGDCKPAKSFMAFSTYVSMFPQLVAGPIVRWQDIEDQINDIDVKVNWAKMALGIQFLVLGLVKKVLIADEMAKFTDIYWSRTEDLQLITGWIASLGYTMQIYFDFSAYSDMAVGLGLMIGFSIPQNFNSPYKAINISDFWTRWHITLSQWLRDYLFIPLGGSRGSKIFTMRNLVITMFLGGLWHGAGWPFVIWGIYHGALLVISHAWRGVPWKMPKLLAIAITFIAVVVGWVFFRAGAFTDDGFGHAWDVLKAMFGGAGIENIDASGIGEWVTALKNDIKARGLSSKVPLILAAGLAWCWFAPNTWQIKFKPSLWRAVVLALLLVYVILKFGEESPFLYFQF